MGTIGGSKKGDSFEIACSGRSDEMISILRSRPMMMTGDQMLRIVAVMRTVEVLRQRLALVAVGIASLRRILGVLVVRSRARVTKVERCSHENHQYIQ